MAKTVPEGDVAVRLLLDCVHGKCNQVVSLPADVAKAACDGGLADANQSAVDAGEVVPEAAPDATATE